MILLILSDKLPARSPQSSGSASSFATAGSGDITGMFVAPGKGVRKFFGRSDIDVDSICPVGDAVRLRRIGLFHTHGEITIPERFRVAASNFHSFPQVGLNARMDAEALRKEITAQLQAELEGQLAK